MKALIVVDMQNDFVDGSLGTPEAVYRSGILDKVFSIRLGRVETGTGFHYYCEKR